jgi:hypothetical protein
VLTERETEGMSNTFELLSRADAGRTVLEEPAPAFSTAQAEEIAQRSFEVRASARPLASERDQNFHLRAEDGSEWVLKIANSAEDPALLDMQTAALLHIAQVDPTLAVPRVRATPEGALFHEVDADDGRRFIVRVLSFLPGQLLDDAAPHPALARDVGAMAARLARALRGFLHPSSRSLRGRSKIEPRSVDSRPDPDSRVDLNPVPAGTSRRTRSAGGNHAARAALVHVLLSCRQRHVHSIRWFMRRRFAARQAKLHSAVTFSTPRRLKRRDPITDLIQANGGSARYLRLRYCACRRCDFILRAIRPVASSCGG